MSHDFNDHALTNMMHAPTGSEHPGREGGREGRREGGRLQAVCDCATYNDMIV